MSTIDHPAHYSFGKIEVIEAIDDWQLGFCEGNVVKYVARAKHKGSELEDLQKARWYLDHAIQKLELSQGIEIAPIVDRLVATQPYVGPFVGKRVESPLEEREGKVTIDDGDRVVVKWKYDGESEYSLKMFQSGIKEKWLVWVKEEEKKDGEQEQEE